MTDKERLAKIHKAIDHLERTGVGYRQAKQNINKAPHWKTAMQLLRALEEDFKPDPPQPPIQVPRLGPPCEGDKSVLIYSPTHDTTGLSYYSAFDCGWVEGKSVIAPEPCKITRLSGNSSSGFSVYATGRSGIKYYFQHMKDAGRAAVGRNLEKGGRIGVIGDFPGARVPHLHLGINVEDIAGKKKQLKYGKTGNGPPYTTGSPTVGAQLAKIFS
jgi:hypothetical protein